MCDASEIFKLCTCADKVNKIKPYWELERTDDSTEDRLMTLGSVVCSFLGRPDLLRELTVQWFQSELNRRQCFDFDYQANDEDKLVLYFGEDEFEFVYRQEVSKWESSDNDSPFGEVVPRKLKASGEIVQLIGGAKGLSELF